MKLQYICNKILGPKFCTPLHITLFISEYGFFSRATRYQVKEILGVSRNVVEFYALVGAMALALGS